MNSQIQSVIAGKRRWSLLEGDCIIKSRKIPDGAVSTVATDPPYGMSYQGKNNKRAPILNDKRPFIWFLPEAYRVLKDGGALICFCQWRGQEDFRRSIELAGFTIRSQVIWDRKTFGMGNTKCTFAPSHDVIWFATKGRFTFPAGRPKSVLSFSNVPTPQRVHSTQKPIELMAHLISAVTPPGELVYDPCAGSGSTGVAALGAGHPFLGCEEDIANQVVAKRRLLKAAKPRRRASGGLGRIAWSGGKGRRVA